MIIETVPTEVLSAIDEMIQAMIRKSFSDRKKAEDKRDELFKTGTAESSIEAKKMIMPEVFPRTGNNHVVLDIFYRYTEKGLQIRILSAHTEPERDHLERSNELHKDQIQDKMSLDRGIPFYMVDFKGYSERYKKRITEESLELTKTAFNQVYRMDITLDVMKYINSVDSKLCDNFVHIDSPKTDASFKFYSVSQIQNMPHIAPYFNSVSGYRRFVEHLRSTFRPIVGLYEHMEAKSKEWNIPMEFPTILEDTESVVGFKSIYPIHLIGRTDSEGKDVKANDLVRINSLPPLNGQIIGLTGQNGGGKTGTISELSYMIYLAQSGLPVFGEDVHLNVKTMVGLVFNTRGQGSQLENFLKKATNVFKEIERQPSGTIVVMLDELGSGAQNDDGIELGKKILAELRKRHVSTIFNTQIPEVAEYAKNSLGGVCFQFTIDHQIKEGIGKGNATELARRTGLASFIS